MAGLDYLIALTRWLSISGARAWEPTPHTELSELCMYSLGLVVEVLHEGGRKEYVPTYTVNFET